MFIKKEEGSIMIFSLLLLSLSLLLISATNFIVQKDIDFVKDSNNLKKSKIIAEIGLNKKLEELNNGNLEIKTTNWIQPVIDSEGEYKTDIKLQSENKVLIKSTGRYNGEEKTLSRLADIPKQTLFYENFSDDGYIEFNGFDRKVVDLSEDNDWVEIPNNFNLNPKFNPFTLEVVIKPTKNWSNGYPRIISKSPRTPYMDTNSYQIVSTPNMDIRGYINDGTENNALKLSGNKLEKNKKYHIVLQWDGINARLIVNGEIKDSGSWSGEINNSYPLVLGSSSDFGTGDINFDGQFYKVRYWSEYRTLEEIRDNMNNDLTGSEHNLVTLYQCNNDSNTSVLKDLTPHNYDGNFNNGNYEKTGDYINIPNNLKFNTATYYNQKTFRIKFETSNDINSRQVIYEQGGISNGLNLYIYDGELYYGIWSETNGWDWNSKNIGIDKNTNYSATFYYDNFNSELKFYLNKVKIGTIHSIYKLNEHSSNIAFGSLINGTKFHDIDNYYSYEKDFYFKGRIYDFKYYNEQALTPEEIEQGNGDLTTHYTFDDTNNSNILHDKKNNYHADIYQCNYYGRKNYMKFDGVEDYVYFPNGNYSSLENNKEISIIAKVKLDNVNNKGGILGIGAYFRLYTNNGNINWWSRETNFGISNYLYSPIKNKKIYTFAGTTKSNDRMRLYINGELKEENSISFQINDGNNNMAIGETYKNSKDFLNGNIYAIAYFNKELTQEKIREYNDLDLTGEEEGLIAYYKFDNQKDQIKLTDYSGNNHWGTIIGAEYKKTLFKNWYDTLESEQPVFYYENNQELKGNNSLNIKNETWVYNDNVFKYDSNYIYKITSKVKQKKSDEFDNQDFFLGIEGLKSNKNTLLNKWGVENNHSSQFYNGSNQNKLSKDFKIYKGYFNGFSNEGQKIKDTTINFNPKSSTIYNPMPLYEGVEYFRPVFIVNYDNGNGIAEMDYIKIEKLLIKKNN